MCLAVTLAGVTPTYAARIEAVNTVTEGPGGMPLLRAVGDPRYLGLTTLHDDGARTSFEVLDLTAPAVVHLTTRSVALKLATGTSNLEGEVVSYAPERAGLHLTDGQLERAPHHWYVELDPRTGRLGRTISLGSFDDTTELAVIGTDATHDVLWFYLTTYGEHLRSDYAHAHGPEHLKLERLDLSTLVVTEVMTIDLPARELKSGYEDRLMVHAAADFSHFAVAEYDERAFKTQPAGRVYLIDPAKQTSFSVPALDTTYGAAFSGNGKYAYLGSSQLGTIARVDLAKQKIDRTVNGPLLTHDLVISPDGSKLFVIGSSPSYTTFDLPGLGNRTSRRHTAAIAPGAAQLFGGGAPSIDGKYYVLPGARTLKAGAFRETPPKLVIARFVD